jgi:hypothetical protein
MTFGARSGPIAKRFSADISRLKPLEQFALMLKGGSLPIIVILV